MVKKISILLTLCLTASLLFFCTKQVDSSNELSQGVVEFDISYPVKNYNSYMEKLIPKKMTMYFKNNVYKNEVAVGHIFTSSIITDCNNKEMVMMLHLNPEKIFTRLNERQVEEMLSKNPTPEIITSNSKDSIIGLVCKRHYGIYDELKDGRDVQLNETNKINITNSNWNNPYNMINGVLTNYEVERFGLNMQFKASQINTQKLVSDSTFIIPENYNEVSLDVYLQKMNDIFSTFLN